MLIINRFPSRDEWSSLINRPQVAYDSLIQVVDPILSDVRARGDDALRDYTLRFDGIAPFSLRVSDQEILCAEESLPDDLKKAIRTAVGTIEAFHAAQMSDDCQGKISVETIPGIFCRRVLRPIQKVGFYVPGGSAPLFSSVLMMAIPARLAKVPKRILCSPPQKQRQKVQVDDDTTGVHPAILYAAHLTGISEIYAVGGAQAIGAMAYGTETIPKVDKIFGPGNQYVTVAKQRVSLDCVGIDIPAGPSELLIIADSNANPSFIAADLLSQAEHGGDSQVVLVTTQETLIAAVQGELARQLANLSRKSTAEISLAHSRAILVNSLAEAVEFSNCYAPEHLIIATENPAELMEQVHAAGSVFLGNYTPESLGDYASGTNHILPTAGWARSWSGVSVSSFLKGITVQEATEVGLLNIGPVVETLAQAEGLDAHALAVSIRYEECSKLQINGVQHRRGSVVRQTGETTIAIEVLLDVDGKAVIETGIGFFDHMLNQIARHSGIRIHVRAEGDLNVDEHHLIEDVGIALGTALRQALGAKHGIARYAFLVPLDESLTHIALDLSGRAHLEWNGSFYRDSVGGFPTEMVRHFFWSLCEALRCSLHIRVEGENDHHKIETVFKAFGRVLGEAIRKTDQQGVPSTKGML
jgi:histidinol dehydrogenase